MARTVYALSALRDAIPLYPVYALLFAASGLSAAQISSLLIIWSAVAFALEIPSGALADRVSRRRLLIIAALIRAAAFALWVTVPSYPVFALGFVLWGASSAVRSGTFEALVYDELAATGAATRYGPIIGTAGTVKLLANVGATLAATPLLIIGGFPLVGWVSAAVCVAEAVLSWTLPERPRTGRVGGGFRGYLGTLRSGLLEARRNRTVFALLIVLVGLGLGAFDEYVPLLLDGHGVPTELIPILLAGQGALSAAASWAAGRWSTTGRLVPTTVLIIGAAALAAGALADHPAGFAGLAVALTATTFVTVHAQIRLQHAITGEARATVTSVAGFGGECTALITFGAIAGLSVGLPITVAVAAMAIPMLALAVALPALLRPRPNAP
ncbi:MFS transporter [Microlunatus parietis]|uniref:MFS family permease n=1 Tax=Microlunatus parietis TaxID=682979 RepID=A0A7Y9I9Z0_9ACTN|nr:MFS transporter [Microlunatus parietis]NYE72820.1 MFS family permease [Microlunatus parietis]